MLDFLTFPVNVMTIVEFVLFSRWLVGVSHHGIWP